MRHIPRFYYPEAVLQTGVAVALSDLAAHHARVVLRMRDGEEIRVFNAQNGEWRGICEFPDKKSVQVRVQECLKANETLSDIWLILAPLKNKDAFDNAIRHAVELGVARIVLVQTDRTQTAKINLDRLQQQITDAAQQSGRLSVPEVTAPIPLKKLLAEWTADRVLLACVEGTALPLLAERSALKGPSRAILIGPEGGFSDAERKLLTAGDKPWLCPVSLGSLVLRSDTAVAASLSLCN